MKFLPRTGVRFISLSLCTVAGVCSTAGAQSRPQLIASTEPVALVRTVQVLAGPKPAVEILSSRPLVPVITKADNPPRLVIDLPDARFAGNRRRIDGQGDQIGGVRIDQYQKNPPVTRVVVDLLKPVG